MILFGEQGCESEIDETLPLSQGAKTEAVCFDAAKERSKGGRPALASTDPSGLGRFKGGKGEDASHDLRTLLDFSGGRRAYGVLGMQRDDPRNRLRQAEGFSTT